MSSISSSLNDGPLQASTGGLAGSVKDFRALPQEMVCLVMNYLNPQELVAAEQVFKLTSADKRSYLLNFSKEERHKTLTMVRELSQLEKSVIDDLPLLLRYDIKKPADFYKAILSELCFYSHLPDDEQTLNALGQYLQVFSTDNLAQEIFSKSHQACISVISDQGNTFETTVKKIKTEYNHAAQELLGHVLLHISNSSPNPEPAKDYILGKAIVAGLVKIVDVLLKSNTYSQMYKGRSLVKASTANQLEIVNLILKSESEISIRDLESAFRSSAIKGHTKVLAALLKGSSRISIQTKRFVYNQAKDLGRDAVVRLLEANAQDL